MKLSSFLTVLIFNWMLWTSVKTTPTRKDLSSHSEEDYTAKDLTKILNDGAESSADTQIQKYKETLKTKLENKKKDTDKGENKVPNKSKYMKTYRQKNRQRLSEYHRNYKKINKEHINKERNKYMKFYRENNNESMNKKRRIYYQNNKEKLNEYRRKWRQNKKNVQSDNNEGTSSVNPQTSDFTNLVKLSIVCEEEGNRLNQGEEKCYNGEDGQNQIEIEEPNKILKDITIDSNKKIHSFDLNEKPEDEEMGDY
ncbi:unnamed protein product [Meloidogyne enterolobii]|uniref:Uncharacterized protein n=1 Tax=Meloidogyne enterolobii TaxID=390850 RepID=A0ACB1A8S2_MELEN